MGDRGGAYDSATGAFSPGPVDGAYYEALFAKADVTGSNALGGAEAVKFLSRSGLPVPVLKQVWDVSVKGKPSMGRQEFRTAMRLISIAQAAVSKSRNPLTVVTAVALEKTAARPVPFPTFSGISVPLPAPPQLQPQQPQQQSQQQPQQPGSGAASPWTILPASRQQYEAYFKSQPLTPDGRLTGQAAVGFFNKSGLNRDILRKIWNLSDVDKDGHLSQEEFCIAFHLVLCASKRNMLIPDALPAELRPQSAQSGLSNGAAANPSSSPSSMVDALSSMGASMLQETLVSTGVAKSVPSASPATSTPPLAAAPTMMPTSTPQQQPPQQQPPQQQPPQQQPPQQQPQQTIKLNKLPGEVMMSGPETSKVAADSSVLNGSLKELTLSVKQSTARAVGEIATIKGDISTMRAERKVLQQELEQEERAFRDHCEELKRLDAELRTLRSEVDASRSQLTSLRQQSFEAREKAAAKQAEIKSVRSAIAEKRPIPTSSQTPPIAPAATQHPADVGRAKSASPSPSGTTASKPMDSFLAQELSKASTGQKKKRAAPKPPTPSAASSGGPPPAPVRAATPKADVAVAKKPEPAPAPDAPAVEQNAFDADFPSTEDGAFDAFPTPADDGPSMDLGPFDAFPDDDGGAAATTDDGDGDKFLNPFPSDDAAFGDFADDTGPTGGVGAGAGDGANAATNAGDDWAAFDSGADAFAAFDAADGAGNDADFGDFGAFDEDTNFDFGQP